MYGADMLGSLFDETKASNKWNPKNFDNLLNRINMKLPGVNNPYLYFGMWKATFAWHLEDMSLITFLIDLVYSYIHFGVTIQEPLKALLTYNLQAPKQWYVIPPAYRQKFEVYASGIFANEAKTCPQYLRHKSCVISPTALQAQGIKVEKVVQFEGEFMITFPYAYHSGYNLGFNCAESVNFAIDSWIEVGKRASFCTCVGDSVKLDVPFLFEGKAPSVYLQPVTGPVARKMATGTSGAVAKLDLRQCALCPGTSKEGLIGTDIPGKWAHKRCGQYVPETSIGVLPDSNGEDVEIVVGIQNIPKDRWSL
ncbi:Lysine-specific demethylase 4B, partial [Rhizoclosmatium sp. JEL0117]